MPARWLLATALGSILAPAQGLGIFRPYRVLLVVDHWADPASQVVASEKDSFQPVAALLKAWSVPFDILRLDQQSPGAGYLFERSGRVRYGAVVWLADADSYANKNLSSLAEASAAGTSLIAVSSRFRDPALEQILGLHYKESYSATDPLETNAEHFITREIARQKSTAWEFRARIWVEPHGAQVLLRQGRHPVLTVRQAAPNSSGVWVAAPSVAALRDTPFWRSLFYRCLVWGLGYMVQPDQDYSRHLLLMFDDWGTSDKTFLSYWRYQTLTEEVMRKNVMPALARHKAVISANVVTGFLDRKTHRVISPWNQKLTDSYGVAQDYASTRRGLKAAEAAGVLEIESHGWTHMQPDLDSPPGPWWTADLEGEASSGGWYEEFEDTRRGTEAPALTQLFHLRRSLQYLREDFGATPLSVIVGGGGWSKSYQNHSARVAAQAGFGLFDINERFFYLDRDLVLDMAGISPGGTYAYDRKLELEKWPPHPDGPLVAIAHDRDISVQHEFVGRTLDMLPADIGFVSMNQYIGTLHTEIVAPEADSPELRFGFDDHYCAYFAKHSSSWRLLLADPLLDKLRSSSGLGIAVDGRPAGQLSRGDLSGRPIVIQIPAGTGDHTWKLTAAR